MKDLGLLLLRVVAGGTLIAHGYTKLFGGEGKTAHPTLTRLYGPNFQKAVESTGPSKFAEALRGMGVPAPEIAAYAAGAAEFGGGVALLTGTMTRLAALAVIVNMVVAIRQAHWNNGFYGQGGFEFPAQLVTAAAVLFISGPGAISVDGLFGGVKTAGRAAAHAGQAVSSAVPSTDDARHAWAAAIPLAEGARHAAGAAIPRAENARHAIRSAIPRAKSARRAARFGMGILGR